jgi:FAD/FMN-containing dehydrogenase
VWTLVCDPGVVLTPENRREVVAAAKAALQRGHTAYLVLPRGVSVQVT